MFIIFINMLQKIKINQYVRTYAWNCQFYNCMQNKFEGLKPETWVEFIPYVDSIPVMLK